MGFFCTCCTILHCTNVRFPCQIPLKVQLCELNYCVLGDNVCVNNHAVLSPHTISLGHTLDIRNLELGDKTTLFPCSGIFGGTKLPNGAMLGSQCRPFRTQVLEPGHEYNDTPCYSFQERVNSSNHRTKPSYFRSSSVLDGDTDDTLKREGALKVARSALNDVLGEGVLGPTLHTKSVENMELQLDSVQVMEYANRIMTKAGCQFEAELIFEVNTVGEVADLLLRYQGPPPPALSAPFTPLN